MATDVRRVVSASHRDTDSDHDSDPHSPAFRPSTGSSTRLDSRGIRARALTCRNARALCCTNEPRRLSPLGCTRVHSELCPRRRRCGRRTVLQLQPGVHCWLAGSAAEPRRLPSSSRQGGQRAPAPPAGQPLAAVSHEDLARGRALQIVTRRARARPPVGIPHAQPASQRSGNVLRAPAPTEAASAACRLRRHVWRTSGCSGCSRPAAARSRPRRAVSRAAGSHKQHC